MHISYLRTGHSRPHCQRYAMEEYRRYRQGHSAIGQEEKKLFPTMQGVKLCLVNIKNLSRLVSSDVGCYQWWCCLSCLWQFPSSSSHCTVGNDSIWNRDRQILYLKSRQHEGNVYWFWRKSPGIEDIIVIWSSFSTDHWATRMVCAQNELHHTVL